MRITNIKIVRWRHFSNVEIRPPDRAPIICVVGGNGTGKSQPLQLIAACAQRVGLSPGVEYARGDPFTENAIFEVTFFVEKNVIAIVDNKEFYKSDELQTDYDDWDRTLTVSSPDHDGRPIRSGGLDPLRAGNFAQHVVNIIQHSESIHYLSLDADRAYPKVQMQNHLLQEIFSRDWINTNKQSSSRITQNLYDEWFRFMIGRENQENNNYAKATRLARNAGEPDPVYVDQFLPYRDALKTVLPHLIFSGIDSHGRQISFDSTGVPLLFDQLSGGEREIAFLIGQIERFGLKRGLLLVDEPELHLNYDLLRSWIGYLKSSVEQGQIWLATHALEVVEVTGQDATIILHRDDQSRRVTRASSLSQQPVVATLSRAIGSPAFSIPSLVFVMIEGDEVVGERERFRLLCGIQTNVRFLESGTCNQVLGRIDSLKSIADASGQAIRLGGVVDGDWRSPAEREELEARGVFVLGVHEVENFFLHPPTLVNFLEMNGADPTDVHALIRDAADRRAGAWVFDAARTQRKFRGYSRPSKEVRKLVHALDWTHFDNIEGRCEEIAGAHGDLVEEQAISLKTDLIACCKLYARKRVEDDLWRDCEGKEAFRAILPRLGLSEENAGERAVSAVWRRHPELLPEELIALRTYIKGL